MPLQVSLSSLGLTTYAIPSFSNSNLLPTGAATAILSNPIWVVNVRRIVTPNSARADSELIFTQTRQTVRTTIAAATPNPLAPKVISEKKLSVVQTIIFILRTDGISAFFKGLGPALILVSNPILQFTVRFSTSLFLGLNSLASNMTALRTTQEHPSCASSISSPSRLQSRTDLVGSRLLPAWRHLETVCHGDDVSLSYAQSENVCWSNRGNEQDHSGRWIERTLQGNRTEVNPVCCHRELCLPPCLHH